MPENFGALNAALDVREGYVERYRPLLKRQRERAGIDRGDQFAGRANADLFGGYVPTLADARSGTRGLANAAARGQVGARSQARDQMRGASLQALAAGRHEQLGALGGLAGAAGREASEFAGRQRADSILSNAYTRPLYGAASGILRQGIANQQTGGSFLRPNVIGLDQYGRVQNAPAQGPFWRSFFGG